MEKGRVDEGGLGEVDRDELVLANESVQQHVGVCAAGEVVLTDKQGHGFARAWMANLHSWEGQSSYPLAAIASSG